MTKEELALEIIRRLKKEYPDAGCTLDYNEAWKLLVSVRLAAQCTDARVNVVVEDLYKKFPSVDALAAANVDEIEEIVRPCGLGKSKARDISACMKMLKEGVRHIYDIRGFSNSVDYFAEMFNLARTNMQQKDMGDFRNDISSGGLKSALNSRYQ